MVGGGRGQQALVGGSGREVSRHWWEGVGERSAGTGGREWERGQQALVGGSGREVSRHWWEGVGERSAGRP